jgi:hypothetical protein
MFHERNTLALLALLCLLSPVPAQNPGDCVVKGNLAIFCHNMFVWSVDPSTSRVTTHFAPVCGFRRCEGVTAAPQNDGILFPIFPDSVGRLQLCHCHQGTTVVIGSLPSQLTDVRDVFVDQSGDLVLLAHATPASGGGLYRFTSGGVYKSTIAVGLAGAVAAEEEPATGDYVVAMPGGDLLRVTRAGGVTTIAAAALPPISTGYSGNLHAEFATGRLLVAWDNLLARLDASCGRLTTLLNSKATLYGLDHDAVHGRYYLADQNVLMRYDPATGGTVQILSFGSHALPGDVTTWGGRMLTGSASPSPGTTYPITLAMPGQAGRGYLAAASFGTRPAIPTPAGPIPLVPDALFFLSLQAPAVFAGFAGVLDANGRAPLAIRIPAVPALLGLRFFVAAIAFDAGGIRRISEPLGVTLE